VVTHLLLNSIYQLKLKICLFKVANKIILLALTRGFRIQLRKWICTVFGSFDKYIADGSYTVGEKLAIFSISIQ